jgi:hypothetical protein
MEVYASQIASSHQRPKNDVKLVMRDANAKVRRETVHQPTIGRYSLHDSTNVNDLRLIDFAAAPLVFLCDFPLKLCVLIRSLKFV